MSGFDEAIDYITRKTAAEPQCLGGADDNIPEDGSDHEGSRARKPYVTEVLDALAILRLHRAVADNDKPLRPGPGLLTTIIEEKGQDRKRVARVLPSLSVVHHEEGNPEIVSEEEHWRDRSTQDTVRKVESSLEVGRSTIAILSHPNVLPPSLSILESGRFTLPPINARMLTLMLEYLYPDADIQVPLTDVQIARLPSLALGPAFIATTPDEAVACLTRLEVRPVATPTGPTLDDVHGQPEAVRTLRQVVRDLEAWRAGKVTWSDVTRSFFLYGPPGTGKTMLAHAMAGSAGINFVKTSYSDCQKAGHQGDMLRELNAAADRAVASAPCGFFIDEIDSFYNRDISHKGYMIGVVNGLLTLIDRLAATEGVVLISATNDPRRVDPAVIRSGRFDRHIQVSAPDRAGIRAMLEAALR